LEIAARRLRSADEQGSVPGDEHRRAAFGDENGRENEARGEPARGTQAAVSSNFSGKIAVRFRWSPVFTLWPSEVTRPSSAVRDASPAEPAHRRFGWPLPGSLHLDSAESPARTIGDQHAIEYSTTDPTRPDDPQHFFRVPNSPFRIFLKETS